MLAIALTTVLLTASGNLESQPDIDPTSTFLATYVFGLRLSTALP